MLVTLIAYVLLTPTSKLPTCVLVIARSGAVPVPVSVMGVGFVMLVTTIVMFAVRAPIAVGENVTLSTQLPPAATCPLVLVGQVVAGLAKAKSAAFVPASAMLVTLSGAPPLFASVMVCAALVVVVGWLVKVRLVGAGVAVGGVTPVPERLTACVVGEASSVNVTVAENGFAVAGVNVSATVHVLFGAVKPTAAPTQVVPEPVTIAKSLGFVPPNATALIFRVAFPAFVRVSV